MKRKMISVCLATVCLILAVACQPPVASGEVSAEEQTATLLNALTVARATGDYTEVEAILARDDASGELRTILNESGALPQNSRAALITNGNTPLPLPPYDPALYTNGDVMVCKGSGTMVSALMDQMLVCGYAHGGILNADLAAAGADNCILSSDADYILGGDEALNYESFLDWTGNDIITVLHSSASVPDMNECIDAVAANRDGNTVYAFLGYLGTPYGSFQPIPRQDNDYWYCSKVPWRVYNQAGINVEDAGFYGEAYQGGFRWTPFRESLLYKTYLVYLFLRYPFRSNSWRKAKADSHVQYILQELISPDELRASASLSRAFTVTAAGVSFDPSFNDADYTGWSIPY